MSESIDKYGTHKKQEELLAMLKDIDSIFKDNNISYSLDGGTLLGAVREKGFIPWDDDVDILVNRDNYKKIVRLFRKTNSSSLYELKHILWVPRIQKKNDKRHRLKASTIDIFVTDNVPDCWFLKKIKMFLIKLLQGMMKESKEYSTKNVFYIICLKVTYFIGSFFSLKRKLKWYQKVSQIGNKKRTKYIATYNDQFKYLDLCFPNDLLDKTKRCSFEDTKLSIISEYDAYLKMLYGDYMKPPSESERVPTHM